MSAESVQAQTRRRLEGRRTIRRRVQRYRPCMSQNDQAKSDHVAPKFYRRVRSSFHMSLEFDSRLASSHSQLGLHGKYVCTQVSSLSVPVLIKPRKHACAARGPPRPFPGIQNIETLSHSQRAVAARTTVLTVSFRGYTSTFDTWTSRASVKAQNGVTGCSTKYVALPCCTHGR